MVHVSCCSCLLVCLLLSAAAAAAPAWRNLGPGGGGWIQSICAGPHGSDDLFVGCDVGGFYRSADGGKSYKICNTGLEDYWVECIVPHPKDARVIYLGCESGVYKSTDRGRSWQWLREGFPPKQRYRWSVPIGALVIDKKHPDTLYAGIGRPRRYKEGAGAVYKTSDGGQHWSRINKPGSLPDNALVSDLVIDPRDNKHLYLACQHGIYQSHDGGVSWEATTSGLPHTHARRLALCVQHPDIIYLTLCSPPGKKPWQGGVYKSTNGGESWKACNRGLIQRVGKPGQPRQLTSNYDRILAHAANPDIVYVGATGWVSGSLYKTTDGGESWVDTVRRGENSNFETGYITFWGPSVKCLTASPLDVDVLYFGTSGHVFKTTDGGRAWRQAYTRTFADGRFQGTGLEVTCLRKIVVHPKDSKRVYFGYWDIGLLVSSDGGETFRRCVQGVEPRDVRNSSFGVVFDPDDVRHCWGGFGGRRTSAVAESSDGGVTWRMVGTPDTGLPDTPYHVLLLDPSSPREARRLFVAGSGGIYASEDGGRSWRARNSGLPGTRVSDLVAHPRKPGIYWCAVGGKGGNPGAIYRTGDWGRSWRKVSRKLEAADIKLLIVASSNPERLYLAARGARAGGRSFPGGVYRSDDGGVTWRGVLEDDFVEGLAVHPRNADIVYAGLTDHPYHDESTGDGIVMTRDGGELWVSINGTGLTCKHVSHIVIDPHNPGRLYLGTGGNGVFVGTVSR